MLKIDKLTVRYNRVIINKYSYSFNTRIHVIIGKSGSGKSTLLKVLAGIKRNYEGEIYYQGKNIKDIKDFTLNYVSYVYQDYQLFAKLTVLENILLPFRLVNDDDKELIYKAKALLSKFNLNGYEKMKVSDLSGGQCQKVAIIRALIKDAEIYLFDEPTSALDKESISIFLDLISRLKNKIVIIITHDLRFASNFNNIIDFDKKEKKEISYEKENILKKEAKIKNLNKLTKQVFKSSLVFNYIATSIFLFGLISFNLSYLMKEFISSVEQSQIEELNVNGINTFQSNKTLSIVDFSKLENVIYYEGISSNDKESIKEEIKECNVFINELEIEDNAFIIDNYLSETEGIIIGLPYQYHSFLKKENYLIIDELKFKIIDYVFANDFTLYSNDINYLKELLRKYNISYEKECYLYANNIKEVYDNLINDDNYNSYIFYLYENVSLIRIISLDYSNLSKSELEKFVNKQEYIIADNINTYIDYYSGYSYLLIDNDAFLCVIDNSIKDYYFNVSNLNIKKITLNNINLYLNKKVDFNYKAIFLNVNTFNALNSGYYATGIIYNDNYNLNKNILVYKINKKTNIEVFNYISIFIVFFAILLIILGLLSFFKVFEIHLKSKRKDLKVLYNLGVNDKSLKQILIKDVIFNLTYIFLFSLVFLFLGKELIEFIYQKIINESINININYLFIFYPLLISFLTLVILYLRLVIFYKKNIQE